MGSLYLARDPAIDRLIAIKLLKDGFDDSVRERFAREARATGRLRHPNIVTVFDVGEHEDRPFIAMEYVPGETLAQLIARRAPVNVSEKLAILEDLCAGLHYAHEEGIVHRDIKPANVILDTSGIVKILDFGIARAGESGITQAGDFVGTLNYMSPEQLTGKHVDHRTDVYALGALAYELVSYRRAFPGTIQDGALFRILNSAPPPLDSLVTGLDPEIGEIVDRAMAKQQSERYQDMAEFHEDLRAVRNRLVEFAVEADPSIDSEAETTNAPGGLARAVQTHPPGTPSQEPPPSGARGSSSGRRPTSASSASRRRLLSSARPAADIVHVKSPERPTVRNRRVLTFGAAAAVLAVILAIVVLWGPWDWSRSFGADPGPPPRPTQLPAPPARTSDAPADSPKAIEERVNSIRATARRQMTAGQREQALNTLSAGLVLDGRDTELNGLVEELRRGAQQMASQARAAASQRGATEQSSREFRDARSREREGDVMVGAGDRVQAVRALWAAAGLYERASNVAAPSIGSSATAAGPPRNENEKTDMPSTQPERQPSAPPAKPEEPLKTLPGTVEQPVSPPISPKPVPPTAGDRTRSETADVAAIRDTLRRYAEAYGSRNIAAINQVMPLLSAQELRSLGRDISNYRSFKVVIENERIRVDGSTATVTCRVTRSFVSTTGVSGDNTLNQVFHLRKVDQSWIIERLDLQ